MRLRRRRPHGHDITCHEAVSLVTDYLEGSLSDRDRARFEAHLALCPHCSEYLHQIRVTIAVTGQVRGEDLGPDAREAVVDLYRRWRDDDQT